ncbi:hypothetical protein LCGC14_1627150 [marine sediment metagenome]|uniref:Uncharacterized protein n=1 Tax=marine sediment metagenome TaxID=412755 RepID=A0A0F9I409_9ZZZZ
MKKIRTPRVILNELIENADELSLYDLIRGDMPSSMDDPRRLKFNSDNVGILIQKLPDSDREVLEELSSEEIEKLFFTNLKNPRPKEPIRRIRGPVKLKTKLKKTK